MALTNPLFKVSLLKRPFVPNGGHAFTTTASTEIVELVHAGAIVLVLEDGKPLGPGDVQHIEIRKHGSGTFSLWHKDLYFSASDNTDCNNNERAYSIAAIDFSNNSAAYRQVAERLARDDAELLDLIGRNYGKNNSFFLNFFGYFNAVTSVLERNHIRFPETVIEIGAGAKPYTALRFLLEGARRFIANDIMEVDRVFERGFIKDLRTLLDLISPGKGSRLDLLVTPSGGHNKLAIAGLEVHDRRPFDEIGLDAQFDLIISTSVLEHVTRPREVLAKVASLLRPGGYTWHSIDLRDHRDFSQPLDFLEMTEKEYAAIESENRLRASDWLVIFREIGLETVECEFGAWKSASNPQHQYSFTLPAQPWVDEVMLARFKSPFDRKDLADLSVLAIRILCRKPN